MERKFYSLLMLLLLAACGGSHAAEKDYHYISGVSPEWIPQPPAEHSAQWESEIKQIVALRRHASKNDIGRAIQEEKLRPELLTGVIGPDVTRTRYPSTYRLLDKVGEDCRNSVHEAKAYWHTDRPYMADKRITTPIPDADKNGAYPSGHTACSLVWAEVLGQLVPAQRERLRMQADSIARHRVISGMHYPHDLAGGEQIGLIFFGELQPSAAYQHDLAEAKREWMSSQTSTQ